MSTLWQTLCRRYKNFTQELAIALSSNAISLSILLSLFLQKDRVHKLIFHKEEILNTSWCSLYRGWYWMTMKECHLACDWLWILISVLTTKLLSFFGLKNDPFFPRKVPSWINIRNPCFAVNVMIELSIVLPAELFGRWWWARKMLSSPDNSSSSL